MAKPDTDDSKPAKPRKHRPFPFRLWLFALAMTVGAGYGGYYWWQHRQDGQAAAEKVKAAEDKQKAAEEKAKTAKAEADDAAKKSAELHTLLDANNTLLDANNKKTKDQEIELTALSNNLGASRDEMQAFLAQRAEAKKRLAAIDDIRKQFAKMIDTGQLKVTARRGSLVLSLPSEVLFPSGVADLSKQGELAVHEVGITLLKRFPDRRFLVVGHTDDQPLKSSTHKDNWELSTARGLTVTRFLVQAGMNPKNLVAAGAGENDPVSEERAKNRRIEIALLPAINELPPLPASLDDDTGKAEAEKPPAPAEKSAAAPPSAPPATAKPDAAKPAAPAPAKP